jgi:RNA polymerase sigma factor (TIGR02999 family)
MSDITLLLHAAESGDGTAAEKLLPLVYDELRRLAGRRLRQEQPGLTLQPTALVHEAWLRLANQGPAGWNDRQHFFRAAALAMRYILVDLARKRATQKRGDLRERVDVADLPLSNPEPDERVLLVNEALVRLEAEDPESARLVTYKFFGGFSNEETAAMLGISERTLNRQWIYAKACLYRLIKQRDEPPARPDPE